MSLTQTETIWACELPDHYGQTKMAFCKEEEDFLCPFCMPDHEEHNPLPLTDLKIMLEKDRDVLIKEVNNTKSLYAKQTDGLDALAKDVSNQIEERCLMMTTLLNQIRDGLFLKKESAISEIHKIVNNAKEYPEKCDIYIERIETICQAENIFKTNITPDELKSFCIAFKDKKFQLENALKELEDNKNRAEKSHHDFSALIDSFRPSLIHIKDSIILQSDDIIGIMQKTEAAFLEYDKAKTGKVDVDVTHQIVLYVLKSYNIAAVPPEDKTHQAFDEVDIMKEGVIAPTQVHTVIKKTWDYLRDNTQKKNSTSP